VQFRGRTGANAAPLKRGRDPIGLNRTLQPADDAWIIGGRSRYLRPALDQDDPLAQMSRLDRWLAPKNATLVGDAGQQASVVDHPLRSAGQRRREAHDHRLHRPQLVGLVEQERLDLVDRDVALLGRRRRDDPLAQFILRGG
jgi:hypothetical protein